MIEIYNDKVTIQCWSWDSTGRHNWTHPAWMKLVDSVGDDLEYDEYEQSIDRIMRKYKAKMIRPSTHPHYMRFPNEKMASWFLLEWS